MISDIQNAIWASEIPKSLNKTAETMFSTTNGKPIAKCRLGIQRRGKEIEFIFSDMQLKDLNLKIKTEKAETSYTDGKSPHPHSG